MRAPWRSRRRPKRATSTSSTPLPTIIRASCHEDAQVSNRPVEPDQGGAGEARTTHRNPLGRGHSPEELGQGAVSQASAQGEPESELCSKPSRIGEALGRRRTLTGGKI